MEKIKEKAKNFIKKNIFSIIIFLLVTSFWMLQNSWIELWDFSSYMMNARYLFYEGSYFELYRAPLASVLLGIFYLLPFTGKIYIIFVSVLFFFSNHHLSMTLRKRLGYNIKEEHFFLIFYLFSLSAFVILYATIQGTELLGLALFELFLSLYLRGRLAGHMLGLAFLTRYNFLIFIIFIFFDKNIKRIIMNLGLFFILVFPWFLFNFIKYGNWFTSVVDSYALNVYYRQHLIQPIELVQFLHLIGLFLPFFIIGLYISINRLIKGVKKKEISSPSYLDIVLFSIAFLLIFDYHNIPFKIERYLFNLSLPVAYFSVIGFMRSYKKRKLKNILIIILIVFFVSNYLFSLNDQIFSKEKETKFKDAAKTIKSLGIEDCYIISSQWVLTGKYTENVYPLEGRSIKQALSQDMLYLIFYNDVTMDDSFDEKNIEDSPKVYDSDDYVILGDIEDGCKPKVVWDNELFPGQHCHIIGDRFRSVGLDDITEKTCNIVNLKN